LQRVAGAIYEASEEPVYLDADEPGLSGALDLGYLERNANGISFSDPDVAHEYLAQHTVDLLLQDWDVLDRFADTFQDARYRTLSFSTRQHVVSLGLLVLANEHSKDVVGRMGEFARSYAGGEEGIQHFWDLYDTFCEALPELDVDADKLADTLESVFQATAGDGAGGLVYGAVEKLAFRSRSDADALYEVFVSRPDSPVVTFAANALFGLSGADLPEAHQRALDLTVSEHIVLRRTGIEALGTFDYAGNGRTDLLERTWGRLETLRAEPDPGTDYVLVRAYGNLLEQAPKASGSLVELAGRPDPAVQNQVAFVLHQIAREAHDEPWYKRALLALVRVPTSQEATWRELDYCAARCARYTPALVTEFAEAIVVSRDNGAEREESKLLEMLGTAFSQLLLHHPEEMQRALTRWFSRPVRGLHRVARDVIQRYYNPIGTDAPPLKLSKRVLDGLDEQTVADALHRILGLIMGDGRLLAALLLSALQREPYSSGLAELVAAALGGYVLYNFPGEAGDYLRSRLERDDVSELERNVARSALERSEPYYEAREELRTLEELKPPAQRVYLLRLAQSRRQTEAMEQAGKNSVIRRLATEIPLKYGRGFFMEQGDRFTEPSDLSELSYSMELPRGELIDPVGQARLRIAWQSAGMGEPKGQTQDVTKSEAADS
jgi:hypothetical protein